MTATTPDQAAPLPWTIAASWATGAGGAAVMSIMFGTLLLRYMTDLLGIGAGVAAALIAVSKLYDAVLDPFVGVVSDNSRFKSGRRRPFLLAGVILCPLSMLVLFTAPQWSSEAARLAYVFVGLLLFATGYAVWQIPYMAMAAEMTDNYKERSRLFAFRICGGTVGQFAAAMIGPAILVAYGGGRTGYAYMAMALALLVLAPCLVCYFGTRRAPFRPRSTGKGLSFHQQLAPVLANRPMTLLLLIEALTFLGLAVAASVLPYFVKYVLQRPDTLIGLMIVVSSAGLLASTPAWMWLGRRIEKRPAAMTAMIIHALSYGGWLLIDHRTPMAVILAVSFVQGVGAAGSLTFRQSMFVDTIEYDYRISGLRREGAFTGIFNLVDKGFSAMGLALVGVALGAAGYISSTTGSVAVQPDRALLATRLLFGLTPTIAAGLGVLLLLPYRLTEKTLRS